MAYKRISPQPVVEGGTGAQTLTSHGVLLGNTTSAITATAAGTTGQVLTGVTSSAPVWASPAASSISITGDSGGALTGAAFTFTGGTTGLTFSGATTTETLTGTLVVANGGTGRATLTNHGVLVGAATTAITQLGVGTNGQVLIGATSADPAFATLTSTGSSITYTTGANTLNLDVNNWVAPTSFTPVLNFGGATTGITYTQQDGLYTRIGRIVTFSLVITLSSKGSATGAATITGLPVTVNGSVGQNSFVVWYQTVTCVVPTAYSSASTTSIILASTSTGTYSALTNTAFSNSSQINISGSYITT